jgi:hypothetical protein
MNRVVITVVANKTKRGYSLRHNQSPGFKGIVGSVWGWYKLKSDAEARANELMIEWNS